MGGRKSPARSIHCGAHTEVGRRVRLPAPKGLGELEVLRKGSPELRGLGTRGRGRVSRISLTPRE